MPALLIVGNSPPLNASKILLIVIPGYRRFQVLELLHTLLQAQVVEHRDQLVRLVMPQPAYCACGP